MPDSICRLTVAACTDDTHRTVDLALPSGVHIGQLLPQIVEIVHGDAAPSMRSCDWRLSRLGDHPIDDSMTLGDNGVRDGEVLMLTIADPPPAKWVDCDPCHAMITGTPAPAAAVPRILPAICAVLLGGCGAVALVSSVAGEATAGPIATGACVAVGAAVGATVVRRHRDDALICLSLSLIAVLYAGAVGFVAVPPGPVASGLLLAVSAAFAAAVLLLRVTGCGRGCLTAIATASALIAAVATAATMWRLEPTAGGAALAILSLTALGFAPRIAMVLTGIRPSTSYLDTPSCHSTLTGLVVGASTAAALGAATVAAGLKLRDVAFTVVVALVLVLRARTHADKSRRVGLAGAATLAATAGFAAVAVAIPAQAHVVSVLAATVGAAALSCLAKPTVGPILVRTAEIVEYLALAAVMPLACWVGGVYESVRGMNLI